MKLTEKERIEREKKLAGEVIGYKEEKIEKKLEEVKIKCEEELTKIDKILLSEELQKKYGIYNRILKEIKTEIEKMKQILNKDKFSPIYGKFITDIPYADEKLINYLLNISTFYKKYT